MEEQAGLSGLRPPDERLGQGKASFRKAGEQPVKEAAHPRAGAASGNPNSAKKTLNLTDKFLKWGARSPRLLKPANQMFASKRVETITRKDALCRANTLVKVYKSPWVPDDFQTPVSTVRSERIMVDSCCPGKATAIPAVPTTSICSNGGSFQNGICLPSSCQRKTWQLATCQETCQPSCSTPSSCEPASCQPICLPAASCVGFVCQPICCCKSGTGQSPRLVSSCQSSCSESTGYQANCCEAGLSQQSCFQEPVFMSRSYPAARRQSVRCDTTYCQPSCSEVTSCPETSCPPTVCEVSRCQPTCCQPSACQPPSGEDQVCKLTYDHPICYIFKAHQSRPCMPISCQPPTRAFSSCDAMCWGSPCLPLHCQLTSSKFFICHPVAHCQAPCFVKNPCKLTSCSPMLSGQPACSGTSSCNQSDCKSPSCQPACSVTG